MASPDDNRDRVSAFLTGDPDAHEGLRRAVARAVRGFRFRADTQNDLVQEALCRLYFNLRAGAFRGDASLVTYAQRIGRYVCLEHLRRRRFAAEVDPLIVAARDAAVDPEAALLRAEEHGRNLRRLARMPPECHELFRLIFLEGLSYAGVAERLGISMNAVKLRVHRCRLTRPGMSDTSSEPLDLIAGPVPRLSRLGETGE
jgi:RNA polymerase sigma-70 factor (ECF subfamily)